MQAAIQNDVLFEDTPVPGVPDDSPINIEVPDPPVSTSGDEGAVAATLWDMFDAMAESWDDVTLGLGPIWEAVKLKPKDVCEFLAFYWQLPGSVPSVEEIFKHHGIECVIVIGFWGAGSHKGVGNLSLNDLVAKPLGAKMFRPQGTGAAEAREFLLAQIDGDGNKILSADEIADKTVKVFGYSLGGLAALQFVQDISKPGPVGGYQLETAIPLAVLVTFDAVIPFPPFPEECSLSFCKIPGTIEVFQNYYQRRGGNTKVTVVETGERWVFGTPLSRALKGTIVDSAHAIRIDTTWADTEEKGLLCTSPEVPHCNIDVKTTGDNVGHDGVPWFASKEALKLLR